MSEANKSVVTYKILSDGSVLPGEINIMSITIHKEVNRLSRATLYIQDGSAAEQNFAASNNDLLRPGKTIEIQAGYNTNEHPLFKGIIIKQSIRIRSNASVLQIECRHPAVTMTTKLRNTYFSDINDHDIITQLAQRNGLSQVNTNGKAMTHREIVQYNCTDWDFVICRCEANGFWLITEDSGKLKVGKPDFNQQAALTLTYGTDINELDAEMDARLQYKSITSIGWDPAEQASISNSDGADPATPPAGNISASDLADVSKNDKWEQRHGALVETELKAWADARWQKSKLCKIRGRVTSDGTEKALPGLLLELQGVGDRFTGKLMIAGVRHQIEKGNWETSIQFGENPRLFAEEFDIVQQPAGALLPSVHGLQLGIVTDLEDPESEERIKVRMPLVQDAGEGAWMRLSAFDAGKDRGWVFRPEVGDEVIVGFLDDDPRFGIVLGKLHSSKNVAQIPPKNDNHIKGYKSRSGMQFQFDDEKKIMTLSTPAGNKIEMNEDEKGILLQDQHGNKIKMDQDGIKMESIKELVVKSTSDMKLESSANINVKASAQLKAEGTAGAELSAGGTTTVKGAIVQIN